MSEATWRDITDDRRVNQNSDVFDHKTRVYIDCGCGQSFDWWNYDEVCLCPRCGKPYRSSARLVVEAYECDGSDGQ